MRSTKDRLLIIGPGGTTCETATHLIHAVPWTSVTTIHNIRDYKDVVINVDDYPATTDSEAWTGILRTLAPVRGVHSTRLWILGDPRFSVSAQAPRPGETLVRERPFLDFFYPAQFRWRESSGHSIGEVVGTYNAPNERQRQYLNRISSYQYTLDRIDGEPNNTVGSWLYSLDEQPVAFTVLGPMGNAAFVPSIDSLSSDETIRLALSSFCNATIGPREAPQWLDALVAPGQDEADAMLAKLENERARIEREHKIAATARDECREVLRMLYEQGDILDRTTRAMLGRMGAVVSEPTEPGKEDGWIEVTIDGIARLGVLEIKGTTKEHFTEEGLKQVVQWTLSASLDQKDALGIFIGASAIEHPPSQRGDPFSASWRSALAKFGLVAVTTVELYRAYELILSGMLDRETFWRSLFAAKGGVYIVPSV
jgi:hypothetical protein